MSFGELFLESLINKPLHLREPVFFKSETDAQKQLEKLDGLLSSCPDSLRDALEKDIRDLKYGLAGEDQVEFELRNSHQPMIVLRDLRLEHEDLSAQIDFLVITPKITYIIECKNLYGDIKVDQEGVFVRSMAYRGKKNIEAMYSPITQNKRHLDLIRKMLLDRSSNPLKRTILNAKFNDWYQSLVVLANPKSLLDMNARAPKEIKEQIVRADQLVKMISVRNEKSKEVSSFEKIMYENAETFLSLHKPNPIDYAAKYIQTTQTSDPGQDAREPADDISAIEQTQVYQKLKQYRLEVSRAEGIKPYFIYNNAELIALIAAKPSNLEELKQVKGFGDSKCQKYGPAILEILATH